MSHYKVLVRNYIMVCEIALRTQNVKIGEVVPVLGAPSYEGVLGK